MNKLDIILIIIVIILYFVAFLLGYIVGKINSFNGVYNSNDFKSSIIPSNKNSKQKLAIDTTKVVTEIRTDSLEKKYDNIGEVKQSTEKISESVNKLKNMKG